MSDRDRTRGSDRLRLLLRKRAGLQLREAFGNAITGKIEGGWRFLELDQSDKERSAISDRISQERLSGGLLEFMTETQAQALQIATDIVRAWPDQQSPILVAPFRSDVTGLLQMRTESFGIVAASLFEIDGDALIVARSRLTHGLVLQEVHDFPASEHFEIANWTS